MEQMWILSMSPEVSVSPGRKQTISILCHEFPRLMGMNKRVLSLTVSNAAERSRRMSTYDNLVYIMAWSSVMATGADSVECVALKPAWLGSCRVFWVT